MEQFIASTHPALRIYKKAEEGQLGSRDCIEKPIDWGRQRAPWLGHTAQDGKLEQFENLAYFGWVWNHLDFLDISIACKGDDAQVNLDLWAVGGKSEEMEKACSVLRNFLWKCWLKKITKEAHDWLSTLNCQGEEYTRNQNAIDDCLSRCSRSDWWQWDHGSRLFFWRWPAIWQAEARDGSPGYHTKYPRPQLHFPQVPLLDQWVIEKDREKLEKLLRRGYIGPGTCKTTVPRFPVPKGSDDIRVVWDLSKNGVHATMYTPTFFLATMSTYLRRIESGFFGGDFDVGEQFHNYMLHESEQVYCGVEIPDKLQRSLTREGLPITRYMRWNRLVFGWQSSPYMALRMFARVIELAKGSPTDPENPFAWNQVVLNLPGSEFYNPSKPRVMKLTKTGTLTADLVTFYDDGATEETTTKALRQITSRIQYYGNQDAARKRRAISQRPGAWAGGVAYTDQNTLRKFISQEKWDKAKSFLEWIWTCLQQEGGGLDRTKFRSGKGFLVHVSLCYDFMLPYMKGFHLSEEAWQSNRDKVGWKEKPIFKNESTISQSNDDEFEVDLGDILSIDIDDILISQGDQAPPIIQPVPRLKEDVHILRIFFEPPHPVQVIVRPVEGAAFVAYGGGDASAEGFGAQMQPLGMKPLLRRGFWCLGDSEESSKS